MSGPKCDSYYVEDDRNELLRQSQRAEAERAARVARERLDAALAIAKNAQHKLDATVVTGRHAEQQHGVDITTVRERLPEAPGRNSSIQEIERYVAEVQATTARIAADIGRAEGVAQLRSLIASSSHVQQVEDWSEELKKKTLESRTPSTTNEKNNEKTREETAQRIVSRLEGSITGQELQAVQTLVKEFLATSIVGRAESLETELRLRVQRANERAQRTRRDVAQATSFLADLRGLQGQEVDSLRDELQAVTDGRLPAAPKLAEKVHAVSERARKRVNDEYAGLVIREELARLGYTVGDNFSTLFVEGGQAIVSRPERPDYGVQMQIDASRGLLDLAVVRFGDLKDSASPERQRRDQEVEEHWCREHDQLRSAMRARGLNGRIIRRLPPGAKPVQIVDPKRDQISRRVSKPAPLQRETK